MAITALSGCAPDDRPGLATAPAGLATASVGPATASVGPAASSEPPVIPVGLDAYLMWDRLPYQRIGARAYMRSTYDRTGNNRSADASHFLYQQSDDFNVTLDVRGTGVLYFKRTNHWHGSPWHYEIDGRDVIVRETSTADPTQPVSDSVFIPQDLFPNPLTWTWSVTKGADLMWVPLPFEKSLRIAYTRTFYGTGYYIYHLFAPGTPHLSRPITSWDRTPPDPRVLDLLSRAGTDIAPAGEGVRTLAGSLRLAPYAWHTVAEIDDAPAVIRALTFTVPRDSAFDFGRCRLRITWDHRWHASVDAPIDLFFGAGRLHNPDNREYLVKGLPLSVRYDADDVTLACYWPMPFFKHARVEIQDCEGRALPSNVRWQIRTVPCTDPVNHVTYFHATFSDHPAPVPGRDVIFLDTAVAEGGGPWSGHFVGMSWIFTHQGVLNTLEGDPRFFFDDSRTPQAWGTGTEEWGGGGDYWGGRTMTLPLAGHPVGKSSKQASGPRDLINSAYRFLIADLFPFGRRAVIGLEHGGENVSTEHYAGIAYWYGVNAPTLVLTDEFNACDAAAVAAHRYHSPQAGPPYVLVSRYECGPDHHGPRMHFGAEEDRVRVTRGTSEFEMDLDPANLGVLLRRKFDYVYPNQCAKVSVRPAGADAPWQEAGLWYTAGSNTCVFSNPGPQGGELGTTQHEVVTGNRRWREEEFLLPRRLTEGVARLAVRLEHVPENRELYPGTPFPETSGWSESRYWAYCYRMP